MIRVLHIFHEMANGGTEHFVMNYYRHIDRSRVQFDFLTSTIAPGYWDEEIRALGGRLFHAHPFLSNPVKNQLDIARIVRENQYRIVHRHTGSAFGYLDLHAARRGGADQLILHAHSTGAGKRLAHSLAQRLLAIDCHHFACSREAGHFLFGEGAPFTVIPNAIDVGHFAFDPLVRDRARRALDVEGQLVIGHVGRFQAEKNHAKLLRVFSEVHRRRPDSALVCVGAGERLEEIRALARELGLDGCVLFTGQRDDVHALLQAFDAFLFPSLYEGFGIALLEAEASGLKCFASREAYTPDTDLTGNVAYIPLSTGDGEWADAILAADLSRDPSAANRVSAAGFDIAAAAPRLAAQYEEMIRQSPPHR